MSRFTTSTRNQNVTSNHEGARAYKLSPEMELYTLVSTFGLNNKFYESADDSMDRLRNLVGQTSPEFVAKLAVYAREQMNLRTVPVVLTVELAKTHSGTNLVSRMVKSTVRRADEINELLGYYALANNRTGAKKLGKVSNQLKKGIKDVFESGRFTDYHFGKYNRKTDVRFRDALFLTHPKPQSEEQKVLFDNITNDTLPTPYTWETELSEAGQGTSPVTTKKKVWQKLIESNKVGYMALLRNLRNIIQADVDQRYFSVVCNRIGDPEQVRRSRQLPFRFLAAYRMLVGYGQNSHWGESIDIPINFRQDYVDQIVVALESAMTASAQNLPHFGNSVFATDVSGSMMKPVSDRSVIQGFDVGTVLCMMAYMRSDHSVVGMFGNDWKTVEFPKENILRNANEIRRREGEVGYSTNGYKVIEWALKTKKTYDNFYIFTDCQLYGRSGMEGLWKQYRQRNPNANIYLFDVGGYGAVPLNILNNGVHLIGGWSDRIFDVLNNISKGETAIDLINQVEL